MREPFLAQIALFAAPLPNGWLPCDGRILPIQGYQALFSLVGTMYGGDGRQNFALPNFSGRAPLGAGYPPRSDHHFEQGSTVTTPATGVKTDQQKATAAVYAIAVEGQWPMRT
jgi:microcystin-dependent protein